MGPKIKPVKTKRRGKITQVRSGIGLSGLDALNHVTTAAKPSDGGLPTTTDTHSAPTESFITSRTARVLLAGAGFLADAYDLFVINLVLRLLRDEYPQYAQSGKIHELEGSVASAALIGSILGQLIAGSLADIFGRKKLFVLTAALISIGSFGSACSIDTPTLTIYGQIALWRFFLGAGVGGEYPLAATVTCESSSARKRGSLMAAVFSMQGAGSLLSGIVVYLCLATGFTTGFAWRFALAFGSLPVLLAFPWRLMMHETESFQKLKNVRQVSKVAAVSPKEVLMGHSHNSHHHPDVHCHHHHQHDIDTELEMSTMGALAPSIDSTPSPMGSTDSGMLKSHAFYQLSELGNGSSNEVSPIKPMTTPLKAGTDGSDGMDTPSYYQQHQIEHDTRERTLSDDYGHHMYISSRNNSNTDYQRSYMMTPNGSVTVNPTNTGSGALSTTTTAGTTTNVNANAMSGTKLGRWLGLAATQQHAGMSLSGNNSEHSPLKGGTRRGDSPDRHTHNPGQHPYVRMHHDSTHGPNQSTSQLGYGAIGGKTNPMGPVSHHGGVITGSACTGDVAVSEANASRVAELAHAFKYYKYHMLGTALSWFLLDIVFYGNGLFNHEVTAMVLSSSTTSAMLPENERNSPIATTALDDAFSSILLSLVSIPGYLLSVAYIEDVGRKNIQFFGFLIMGILYFTCAYGYDYLLGEHAAEYYGKYWFLLIYSLTFLFSNFGPNTTSFVIPGEIYPAEVRATCHGLSAACGKLGAATGAYFFPLLLSSMQTSAASTSSTPGDGLPVVMYSCALVAVLGAIVTHFFTPRYDGVLLETKEQIENDKSDLASNASSATLNETSSGPSAATTANANGPSAANGDCDDSDDDEDINEETFLLNHSSYIPLEHSCLRPKLEDLRLLVQENDQYYNSYHALGGYQSVYDEDHGGMFYERKKRKDGYEMLEIIQTADNYAMDDL